MLLLKLNILKYHVQMMEVVKSFTLVGTSNEIFHMATRVVAW